MMPKKIVLDAGHGGIDPGAQAAGVNEDDINLRVVMAVGNFLSHYNGADLELFYTRSKDVFISLTARLKMIEEINPDVFVSVHCNSADEEAWGIETFYRDESDKPLAESIQKLLSKTGLKSRGSFQDVERLGKRLTVLNSITVPSCLVEIGFLSNASDREYLIDHISGIAELIAHGILKFLEVKNQ